MVVALSFSLATTVFALVDDVLFKPLPYRAPDQIFVVSPGFSALPNATFILWQDLYADRETLKFKSPQEIKALIEKTGWKPDQEVVTYCMVGMRASLMYFAAKAAGVPVRVYLGSWQEWSKDPKNPIVK